MNTLELKQKGTKDLLEIAEQHGIKNISRQKKADIIFNQYRSMSVTSFCNSDIVHKIS